uniref:Lactate dehydrogenase n=1 Tax=Thermosporothrix sp. COM3 TaxID=2490863 RepID=A0A455SPW8_9CHLR|nr:lactate dehydrogenase [Thermosporothrix sp. COM3]
MKHNTSPVLALATGIHKADAEHLHQALGPTFPLLCTEGSIESINPETLSQVQILLPFIHPTIGPAEMEAMPRLRLIATRSTGYDHIDLQAATQRGILVANVPGYGETAVAEYTFGLLLTVSRKLHLAYRSVQQASEPTRQLQGFDLYGKTLGVIGAGAIGLHVIRIARGFGMQVLAYDVMPNRIFAEVLGFLYVPLDELLASSDVVSLHAPALPSTYHLLNTETFRKMKRGALLINTARGSLVETEALLWALDNGILRGAGLDTLEDEDDLQHLEQALSPARQQSVQHNQALMSHDNVVVTPHMAFNSIEAVHRILNTSAANVLAFLRHQPQNLVTQEKNASI